MRREGTKREEGRSRSALVVKRALHRLSRPASLFCDAHLRLNTSHFYSFQEMIPDVRPTHPDGQDGAGTGPVETAMSSSSMRATPSSSAVAAARASSAAAGTSSVTSRCVVNAPLRVRTQTGFLHAVWTQWCVFRLLVRPTLSLILLQKAPQRNVRGKICRARHDCGPPSHSTLTFTKRLRRWRPRPSPPLSVIYPLLLFRFRPRLPRRSHRRLF